MSAVRSLIAVLSAAAAMFASEAASAQAAPSGAAAWVTAPGQVPAQPPPWAPCGLGDSASKLAHLHPNGAALRCGTESWGYRHILKRHLKEFEEMAFGTNKEVGRKVVRVITSDTKNNDIITAYPAGHC